MNLKLIFQYLDALMVFRVQARSIRRDLIEELLVYSENIDYSLDEKRYYKEQEIYEK